MGCVRQNKKRPLALPLSFPYVTLPILPLYTSHRLLFAFRKGGKRRVLVRPERGWKDQSSKCADIVFKADIGAEVEQVEACMDKTRLPQPRNFQARRRMARRFDESLLVEIELAKVNK